MANTRILIAIKYILIAIVADLVTAQLGRHFGLDREATFWVVTFVNFIIITHFILRLGGPSSEKTRS